MFKALVVAAIASLSGVEAIQSTTAVSAFTAAELEVEHFATQSNPLHMHHYNKKNHKCKKPYYFDKDLCGCRIDTTCKKLCLPG